MINMLIHVLTVDLMESALTVNALAKISILAITYVKSIMFGMDMPAILVILNVSQIKQELNGNTTIFLF